jgi:outer membrane cobalamin receptor
MKIAIAAVMLLGAAFACHAQDSLSEKKLDEIIIYSNKFAERKQNIVQKTEVISAQRIAQINAQNTGDLLMNTGNVFVQRSQQGGGSPVLRGFEASRVLLVVDGIRMNNAIYRAGHLQNVITVDQNSLERVEVLYGPASTLYGSDALGGVVLLRTKQPLLAQQPEQMRVSGSGFTRYSSANNEKTAHVDLASAAGVLPGCRRTTTAISAIQKWDATTRKNIPILDGGANTLPNQRHRFGRTKQGRSRAAVFRLPQWDVTQKFLFQPNRQGFTWA